MRTRMLSLAALLASTLLLTGCASLTGSPMAAVASQQTSSADVRTIEVTGEAEVRVVPDEVIITLGVETMRARLADAKAANDAAVSRLLGLCEAQGIDPRYVKTDYIGIEPRYRDAYPPPGTLVGYVARKTVEITLHDISRFEDLLSEALEQGANYVHGVQFRTTELRRYRDEARALAIRAAQEKAVAMAGELGHGVGEPRAIREDAWGWFSPYGSWWGYGGGSGMTQNVIQEAGSAAYTDGVVAPGEIAVSARVSVTFDLE